MKLISQQYENVLQIYIPTYRETLYLLNEENVLLSQKQLEHRKPERSQL